MIKLEKVYKLLEKYYWLLFILLIIIPNFLEPTWFWRWLSILLLSIVFITIFLWGYYAWIVLKREPISLTTISKKHLEELNSSQKKWHIGLFYIGMIIVAPLLLYMSSFPIVDTVKAITRNDYVQITEVTIIDRTTTMGTWFIGQSLKIEEENISDGGLLLMFSLEHALEGERYEIKYLPYSGLVLELNEVKE